MRLDTKTIEALTLPKGKLDHIEWDDELPRFGFRIRQRGGQVSKTWLVQYRIGGKSQRVTIGNAGLLSVTKAREAARKLLANVALGADPQAERAAKRQASELTFSKAVASYLEGYRRTKRKNSYRSVNTYLAGPHLKPLHGKALSEITFTDMATQIRRVEDERSTATAWHVRKAVAAFFTWAISEGLLGQNPVNPVAGTRRPALAPPRDRVLSGPELAAIWRVTEDEPEGRYAWRCYCRIIRLLMLLGGRANEVGGMKWSEFDLGAGTWTLPKERSKNHRPLTLMLPKVALDIVATGERRAEGERLRNGTTREGDALFGMTKDGFRQWAHNKPELDRRLGAQVKPWHVHDLRRSAATHMAEIGVAPHVIEAALNDYSGVRRGVAGIYNRSSYDREVAAALVRWSEHLMMLVEGRTADNVVPLRGAS